jgi:hypothetical protein
LSYFVLVSIDESGVDVPISDLESVLYRSRNFTRSTAIIV